VILTAFALATTMTAALQETVLLPGYADLPTIAGATSSATCRQMLQGAENPPSACIEAPLGRPADMASEYDRTIRARGWRPARSERVSWYERSRADGQCDRLGLLSFWDFQKSDPVPGEPVYLAFLKALGDCETAQ